MQYSIIIPAWNEEQFLPATLSAARQAMKLIDERSGHHGKLIVVDNNSTDATATIAREANAEVVFEPVNQIARARNRGAEAAIGQALIFIDSDTLVSEGLLGHALNLLDSGAVVGGGSLIAPDRELQGTAMQGLKLWNLMSRRGRLAAGCFVFCRKDAFDLVGGFNERVYAGEEIYLSRRLKRWGRRQGMTFEIVEDFPIVTSVRKLDWYSPQQIIRQAALVLIPGAIYSKRFCKTWYQRR